MDLIQQFIDIFLHLDKHLVEIIRDYGIWTYGILFLIIFCETGLVITPFLPGDSLLFAIGALAATGNLDIAMIFLLLTIAGILGDTVNYWIGAKIGPKVFASETSRFLNKKHLMKTHEFYEKYGGKTIIIARFMPIIRTFAPFVAGIGKMSYRNFVVYNIVGAILWVGGFLALGYGFGNIPSVKRNFTFVIIGIVIVSIMPAVIEYLRSRRVQQV